MIAENLSIFTAYLLHAERIIMKEVSDVKIIKKRFQDTINYRGISIRELGRDEYIDRTEKSIRNYRDNESIPKDVLERIARRLNVEPAFLAGDYDRLWDKIGGKIADYNKANLCPDDYPFFKAEQHTIEFDKHFKDTLIIHGISWEQYKSLPPLQRIMLRRRLTLEQTRIISQYFDHDAFGRSMKDILAYDEAIWDDIDPDELEQETNED